jgi:hypothetical protein
MDTRQLAMQHTWLPMLLLALWPGLMPLRRWESRSAYRRRTTQPHHVAAPCGP